jgi:hypothetical protein
MRRGNRNTVSAAGGMDGWNNLTTNFTSAREFSPIAPSGAKDCTRGESKKIFVNDLGLSSARCQNEETCTRSRPAERTIRVHSRAFVSFASSNVPTRQASSALAIAPTLVGAAE